MSGGFTAGNVVIDVSALLLGLLFSDPSSPFCSALASLLPCLLLVLLLLLLLLLLPLILLLILLFVCFLLFPASSGFVGFQTSHCLCIACV